MAYEKQTWETGEVITAEKLNHIEDGIMENGSGNNLIILPFTEAGNTIVTTLTYSDITDVYAKYQSGDAVALTIDMEGESNRATLFVTSIQYNAAEYGNPEQYDVLATGIYSMADPNNTFVYLVTVTFKNGAETIANVTVKHISLTN